MTKTIHIHRQIGAPPETVFQAFTSARMIEQWLCPSADFTVRVAHLDLRVGGRYRFEYSSSGQTVPVVGEYRIIDRPRCLAFTWTWEEPDPFAGVETLVTVDLLPAGAGTEVHVRHEHLPTGEKRARHESGWNGALERLEQQFAI